MSELYWDPFDVSAKGDPHQIWSRMRRQAPVYRNQQHDFWALSRFSDVDAAHRDPQTFSSAHGTVLELMSEAVLAPGLMIFMDPPGHTYLRRLVSRAFTPRRIAMLEPGIRALCASLLRKQQKGEYFDFVQDFGARIPAAVIADLLGVPPSDQEPVRVLIDQTFHLEPDVGMANEESVAAMDQLTSYVSDQLAERQTRPRDDMFTELIRGEVFDEEGRVRRLSLDEATMFAVLLASAGTETVARLIGWAGLVLADHADQRTELASDPGLIGGALEELLRYEAPSPVQGRWTTQAVELHGCTIPANSRVLLLTGSAGRDEHHFADPDRFDIHRAIDHHVSFGYGIHFCLGAALARLEGRVALEEVLRRFPEWTVDKENAVALHTSTVRGYSKLPVLV